MSKPVRTQIFFQMPPRNVIMQAISITLCSTSTSDMSLSSSIELVDNLFINYSNNNIDEMKSQFAEMSWYGRDGIAKFVCRLKPDDLCKYNHYLVSHFKLIDLFIHETLFSPFM